jgi:hypothetical protein
MSARRLVYCGAIASVVTYLLLAPFRCDVRFFLDSSGTRVCKGLVAFEYPGAPMFLAPQLLITSLLTGFVVALALWLMAWKPVAHAHVRVAVGAVLLAVTAFTSISMGGAIVYAAPILVVSFWWMAWQSGRVMKIVWSFLAAWVAFFAAELLLFMLIPHPGWAVVAVFPGVGAGLLVLGAPISRRPDPWARP